MTLARALKILALVCFLLASLGLEVLRGWGIGWLGLAFWCASEFD